MDELTWILRILNRQQVRLSLSVPSPRLLTIVESASPYCHSDLVVIEVPAVELEKLHEKGPEIAFRVHLLPA